MKKMKKVGIDFFPYPSTNDVNVTTILGDFGAMGVSQTKGIYPH